MNEVPSLHLELCPLLPTASDLQCRSKPLGRDPCRNLLFLASCELCPPLVPGDVSWCLSSHRVLVGFLEQAQAMLGWRGEVGWVSGCQLGMSRESWDKTGLLGGLLFTLSWEVGCEEPAWSWWGSSAIIVVAFVEGDSCLILQRTQYTLHILFCNCSAQWAKCLHFTDMKTEAQRPSSLSTWCIISRTMS